MEHIKHFNMTSKEEIKHVMANRFNRYVKNYKTDLEIDLKYIDDYLDDKINFIYILRKNGSNILDMFEIKDYEKNRKVKYL